MAKATHKRSRFRWHFQRLHRAAIRPFDPAIDHYLRWRQWRKTKTMLPAEYCALQAERIRARELEAEAYAALVEISRRM